MITRILNSIYVCLQELGKAKAAAHLARTGRYAEAQAMLNSK